LELTRDRVGPATDASLRRLGTDQLDLLLIHSPSPEVPLGETLAAVVAVIDAGRTRDVALSNLPPSLVREALEHAPILCTRSSTTPSSGSRGCGSSQPGTTSC
jgi:2,5-diketo-D-gluconate reductase B